MELNKYFSYTLFPPEVIRQARDRLQERSHQAKKDVSFDLYLESAERVSEDYESEDEFFAAYRKEFRHASYRFISSSGRLDVRVQPMDSTIVGIREPGTMVRISAPLRADALYVLDSFEAAPSTCGFHPRHSTAKIFIGHGRSAQWRELKDHLTDLHQFEVIAYEVGARAGLSIKEVLETMLSQSSMAFLVLTAEDRDEHGNLHARENVIHELGLFQGRLGFTHAIVLLEEGVTEFSNIHGINQIRFRAGRIREAFGDVLATIKREVA